MIRAGAASRVINNELGAFVQGASVDNVAESIRDDLEANALFLASGDESVLLVSCDVAGLGDEFVSSARAAMAEATGGGPRSVIIASTHTHAGPSLLSTNYLKPIDMQYLERLHGRLVELAREAAESARPARVGWGVGEARIGYNRRCCWADGTHTMHGDAATRADFTGLEGPDDPQHLALFVRDREGAPIAVLHHNTSHPTCFYGANFTSADFPGAARTFVREALGPLPVLFFNGAFGDISIEKQTAPERQGDAREQKMLRAAHLVAGETLRLLHEARFHDDPILAHVCEDMQAGVRLPDTEKVEWARGVLARVDAGESVKGWDSMWAHGVSLLQETFGADPTDTLALHAVRIGDVALFTEPCELYCRFGLDIKRRSPSPHTAVVGIADGYAGYCATAAGHIGGGYSGDPLHWSRFEMETGYRIVDVAARLLHSLWSGTPCA